MHKELPYAPVLKVTTVSKHPRVPYHCISATIYPDLGSAIIKVYDYGTWYQTHVQLVLGTGTRAARTLYPSSGSVIHVCTTPPTLLLPPYQEHCCKYAAMSSVASTEVSFYDHSCFGIKDKSVRRKIDR